MNVKTSGVWQMTLAMMISGTVGWPVLMLGQPATTVVFWRCAFGALAMLVACALLGLLKKGWLTRRQAAIAVLGGVALVLNWTLLFAAYSYASIAVATVTYHVQPFMLVGLGVLFFGEKLTANKIGWLLLAFGGMLLIITGKHDDGAPASHYFAGVMLALGAAFMYAVAAAIVKQLKGVPPHLIVLIQLTVGVVLLVPFAGLGALPSTANAWLLLATLGLVHTGLMSSLLYSAIQKIPTSLVGALSFIYPIVAIIVDWAVFGHRLSLMQLLGAAAILLAAAGMNFGWRLMRAKKKPCLADES